MNESAIKVEDNQSWETWIVLKFHHCYKPKAMDSDGHSESNWWT